MAAQMLGRGFEVDERTQRAVDAQAAYNRRIGETVEIPKRDANGFDTWKIVGIVQGDDKAPVLLESSDRRIITMPALHVQRIEAALQAHRAIDATVVRVDELPSASSVPVAAGKKSLKVRFVEADISEGLEDRASDSAEETLHREERELRGVSGFLLRIAKHNIGYEISRQLGLNRARTKILTEKNLLANEGGTREEHESAVGSVVDRFLAEHDEFLHQEGEKGERRIVFGDSPAELAVKQQLDQLVRAFASNPSMTEEELDAAKARIFADANKLAGVAKGRGLMYADNLKEIAETVRVAARHAGGIDNIDLDIEFVVGKAKLGARTEHEKNLVDRTLEKLERWGKDKHVIGGVFAAFRNEIAVALGTALAIGTVLSRTALSSGAAKLATFGGSAAVTGLYSWWREKGRLNRERSLHERQMTLGGELWKKNPSPEELDAMADRRRELTAEYQATPLWHPVKRFELKRQIDALFEENPQPRRQDMERFAMARANAKDLTVGANSLFTPDSQLKPDVDPAIAMQMLADMDARVRISNANNVDLLRYSSVAESEVERRNLDDVRMRLKAALRANIPDFQTQYDGVGGVYELKNNELYGDATSGVRVTQEKFAKYVRGKAFWTGVKTAAIGAGFGAVAGWAIHDLSALITHDETVAGSVGKFVTWLREYVGDHAPTGVSGTPVVDHIGSGILSTPSGTHFVPQPDGTFSLESVADHKTIASGLHVGNDGMLDIASKTKLSAIGAAIVERDTIINSTQTITERVGVWDWLHGHAPDVTSVHRDIWLANDTSAPVFDFNEQGLHWGGSAGVNAHGDFVMDASSMTSGGSWQGAMHVDALKELAAGKMRLVLTMTEGSQNHAVEIVIDEHGQAIIPANSDIARTFFAVQNGKAVFLGKYAEVALSKGFDEKGVDHLAILATHIGNGLKDGVITRDIAASIPQHVTQIGLPATATMPSLHLPWMAPLPIRRRTPLERLAAKKKEVGGARNRGPLMGGIRHVNPYYNYSYESHEGSGSEHYFTEVSEYRISGFEKMMDRTLATFKSNPELSRKYGFVLRRLDTLVNFDIAPIKEKQRVEKELQIYNLRYFGSANQEYISLDTYVGRQIMRTYKQIENILLDEARVGDRPFSKEFYDEAPFIKGVDRAEEIVLLFNPAIGDAVLSTPIILALDQYLKQIGANKKIVLVTKQKSLFESLEKQYSDRVEVVAEKDLKTSFSRGADKERFIMNANTNFNDYGVFGLSEDQVKDTSRVMSFDCTSWTMEESPVVEGRIKKYDPMPARIMRNIEQMVGQKLFQDIHEIDHFLERSGKFDEQSSELRSKYGIAPAEKILVISPGSSVTPKEWLPERWNDLLSLVKAKYPNVHVLWLEDPNQEKREMYGEMIDRIAGEGLRVSRVIEGLDYMNTIMSMADLSITPDTGLGHLCGALGKKNVMITLVNPVQWSTGNTVRVMHRKAYEVYKKGGDTYGLLWRQPRDFYVDDHGRRIGASDILPQQVFEKVEKILG